LADEFLMVCSEISVEKKIKENGLKILKVVMALQSWFN